MSQEWLLSRLLLIIERFNFTSLARLICFLALTVIVFLDIWVSFGATWVVGIQGEQRMQNNQKVLFHDFRVCSSRCF